ncbi:uncharacterized protein yc1106_09838 [Curvularia clavata]|uniref:Uncharacterized protein n=1 Tax=Curvularia clavata TaxID=95742 RepID=A0A9Q8ZJC6_CURCL|nr:uncharacterized protein yc1106_09838 [Curvularia clavata]
MAEEASPLTSDPAPRLPPSSPPPLGSSSRDAVYGSLRVGSFSHDSGIDVSPTEALHPSFAPGRRYYIYPPFIKGHGRLIPARRTVPYLVGLFLVIAVFGWGVCAALSVYPLLRHTHPTRG